MIHIYNQNGEFKETLNYTKNEFKKEWYDSWKDGDTISEIKYNYPILEKETLREATREELVAQGVEVTLQEGEIIKDRKIIFIPKPTNWHQWNGTEWIVNLDEVKLAKREELKNIRDDEISEDLEVEGAIYQVKDKDLQKFFLKKIEADLYPDKKGQKEGWRLADNTLKFINFYDIEKVLEAYGNRQRQIFKKFVELDYRLTNSQSVEEIEAIKWK